MKSFDNLLNEDLIAFRKFLTGTRLLKIGVWFNFGYYLITIGLFLFYFITDTLGTTIIAKDFSVFYTAVRLVKYNPAELYTSTLYNLPFRYLPLFAYFFSLLSLMPFPIAFIVHTTIMFCVNFGTWYFVFLLTTKLYHLETNRELFQKGFFYVIMGPLQMPNYILGQISSLFIFLLVVVVFLMENLRLQYYSIRFSNIWIGFLIGSAIVLKPIALLCVPFIFPLHIFHRKDSIFKNQNIESPLAQAWLARAAGLSIIILSNLFIFSNHSGWFHQFFAANFEKTLDSHQSTSLTRLILDIAAKFDIEIPLFQIMFPAALFFGGLIYLKFLSIPNEEKNTSQFFGFAILVVMLAYPDSWFLYVMIWFVLIFPSFIQQEQEWENKVLSINIELRNKNLKRGEGESDFLKIESHNYGFKRFQHYPSRLWWSIKIIKWNMIYFSVGVVLHYFILGIDPITPISLLLVYFLLLQFQKNKSD